MDKVGKEESPVVDRRRYRVVRLRGREENDNGDKGTEEEVKAKRERR